jgi:hypothetical protein
MRQTDVISVMMVVVFLPLIPWAHVWRRYVVAPGDRGGEMVEIEDLIGEQ